MSCNFLSFLTSSLPNFLMMCIAKCLPACPQALSRPPWYRQTQPHHRRRYLGARSRLHPPKTSADFADGDALTTLLTQGCLQKAASWIHSTKTSQIIAASLRFNMRQFLEKGEWLMSIDCRFSSGNHKNTI